MGLLLRRHGLLSYVLEVFGEHTLSGVEMLRSVIAVLLLAGYGWHATTARFPMLRLSLFRIRTFARQWNGNFLTRLGIGGSHFFFRSCIRLARLDSDSIRSADDAPGYRGNELEDDDAWILAKVGYRAC